MYVVVMRLSTRLKDAPSELERAPPAHRSMNRSTPRVHEVAFAIHQVTKRRPPSRRLTRRGYVPQKTIACQIANGPSYVVILLLTHLLLMISAHIHRMARAHARTHTLGNWAVPCLLHNGTVFHCRVHAIMRGRSGVQTIRHFAIHVGHVLPIVRRHVHCCRRMCWFIGKTGDTERRQCKRECDLEVKTILSTHINSSVVSFD